MNEDCGGNIRLNKYVNVFTLMVGMFYGQAINAVDKSAGNITSDSFLITFSTEGIKVVSPEIKHEGVSIIVTNKSKTRQMGKLVNAQGDLIQFFSIDPMEFKTYTSTTSKEEHFIYVPMSPAYQALQLRYGQSYYEIPPKK